MFMNLLGKPFGLLLYGIFRLTNNLPVAIIILATFFTVVYYFFNLFKRRVSLRVQFAGRYAEKFKAFASSPNVFDNYLTKIYKTCKVNQLSSVIFGIIGLFLFMAIINVVYSPLSSAYGLSELQRETLLEFLVKNYKISNVSSDFTMLNTVFENSSNILLLENVPQVVEGILNTSTTLFGINFINPATFSSITILFPITFILLYIRNVVITIKSAINKKTNGSFALAGISIFFLVSIASSAFFFPLLYFLFILIYRVLNLLFTTINNKYFDKYLEKIKMEFKEKCDEIYNQAQEEFNKELALKNIEQNENEDSGELTVGENNVSTENIELNNRANK